MAYNGWTNWETWNCNLWYDDFFVDEARTQTAEDLAEYIENFVRGVEFFGVPNSGLARDLLEQSLSEVDWLEIAEAYIENYGSEDEDEEEEDEDSDDE